MATWEQVQQNDTLYPDALRPGEGEQLKWHQYADQPHSSQVFCISAFGTLRRLAVRDQIINRVVANVGIHNPGNLTWNIEIEKAKRELLSEFGSQQASSIDTLLVNETAVVSVEAKLLVDAEHGFGTCGQPGDGNCAGFHGPGSDLKTGSNAWCRLEIWDGNRSPRTYWTLGRAFFQDSVFSAQAAGGSCPFNGPNYQLMRNFLFAASLAQRTRKRYFGVVAIAPERTADNLKEQIDDFRKSVLQPQFARCVQLLYYEQLIEFLGQSNDDAAINLGWFLQERIDRLIP